MTRAGRVIKRAFDIATASAGLLVSAPVLLAAALAIKLEDGGPILFRQERIGRGGRAFRILKLRTMVVDAERKGAGYAVNAGDSRITRAGAFLRKTSIDELPQLVNILAGQMSVVGPRPTLRYQVEAYDERQRHRLDVPQGVTGWAQIHGRAALPWDERIELDLWYVEHASLWLDLRILVRTPLVLFRKDTLYKGDKGGWKAAG